jgi:hypothetical protein
MILPPFPGCSIFGCFSRSFIFSIEIELNGKMTGRLQIGNVGSGSGKGKD